MKNNVIWTPAASKLPVPVNPDSEIVPVIATVELPDDPFKPGQPYRTVFHGGWWSVKERVWYFDGYPAQDEVKVLAWINAIPPWDGPRKEHPLSQVECRE